MMANSHTPLGDRLIRCQSHPGAQTKLKDGRAWRIGAEDEVAWVNAGVTGGRSITAAVPSVSAAYATLAFPVGFELDRDDMRPAEDRFDDAVLSVLSAHTEPQPWWLAFLETGASDVVLDDAPRARVYGWNYVLVRASPHEARTWRSDDGRWFTALRELMFPADHSWLVSSLWDDAWACVGGSPDLRASDGTGTARWGGEDGSVGSRYVADKSARRDAPADPALAQTFAPARRQGWRHAIQEATYSPQ